MIARLPIVLALLLAAPVPARDLRLIAIDVEGGAANLYITPGGKSLLIDTGFPAGMGEPPGAAGIAVSSAQRIAAAARNAGLTRIDHVLISHYHVDHVGGLFELMALIPVGAVIDHGVNRELSAAGATPGPIAPATTYPRYIAAIAGKPRRQLRAGDRVWIDGLELTAVASDGEVITRPLAGAGGAGIACATAADEARDGGEENWRSLGVRLRWGKARVLSLGDATLRLENRLACPRDLIGPVDLMFASNHGSANAGSEALLRTVQPRIILVSNGPTKGADAAVMERLKSLPFRPAVWQLHVAMHSAAADVAPDYIANLDRTTANNLMLTISDSGKVRVTNQRTGLVAADPN
jgi:beta-lactamase superfamily II metal-dependent hydrolase